MNETALNQISNTFTWILHSTLEASVLIILILTLQTLFKKKLPLRFHSALWLILIIKMFLPWAPESTMSLYNLLPASSQQTAEPQQSESVKETPLAIGSTSTPRQREALTADTKPTVEERLSSIEVARNPNSDLVV